MKKNSAIDFYLKVVIWTFFCIITATVYNEAKALILSSETTKIESSAAQMIQAIRTAQTSYAQKHNGQFALTFNELVKAGLLDEGFDAERLILNGYVFEMKVFEATNRRPSFYLLKADPLESEDFPGHFYFDSTLEVIKVTKEDRQANAYDASF
jgi:hypothetical protein